MRLLGCLGDVGREYGQRICSLLFRLLELWRGSGPRRSFGFPGGGRDWRSRDIRAIGGRGCRTGMRVRKGRGIHRLWVG